MEDNKWCVYVHTNKINGKKYVGITKQKPELRWGKNGIRYKRQSVFYNAIQKYGWDNFEHNIIESGLTEDEAKSLEIYYICMFGAKERQYGYNMTIGGDGTIGYVFTQEHRQKIGEAQKGDKHYLYGKHLPKETRQKISLSLKGKKHSDEHNKKMGETKKGNKYCVGRIVSDETRKKISESAKGREGYFKGKHFTEEHKKKLSESKKGKHYDRGKKVICCEKVFSNIKQCAYAYGVSYPAMYSWLSGNRKMPQEFKEMGLSYYEL